MRPLAKAALGLAAAVALFAVFGFLVAPMIVKSKLEVALTEASQRRVTIERVRVNPFTLSITVEDFAMRERDSEAPFVTFAALHLDASTASLLRLAPVLDRVRLTRPHVRVTRQQDKRYNFQDLVEKVMNAPKSDRPLRFSLNNIELIDGRIDFDDRPERKRHEVTAIGIGIPFISNLPYAVDIDVQPALAANVNGSPLALKGESKPFKDTHDTTLAIDFDRIDLPRYIDYSPVPLPVKLTAGELHARLTLRLATRTGNELQSLTLAGSAELRKLAVADRVGAPIAELQRLAAEVDLFDAIANSINVKSVLVEQPVVHVTRRRDGSINLLALVPPQSPAAPATAPAKPLQYRLARVGVVDGRVIFSDQQPVNRPFETDIRKVGIEVESLSNEPGARAKVKAGYETTTGASFGYDGDLQLEPVAAEGRIDVKAFRLADLFPYYEDLLNLQVDDGKLDLDARVTLAGTGPPLELTVTDLNAVVRSLMLTFPGEKQPLWRLATAEVRGGTVDLARQRISLGEVSARDGAGSVRRDKNGTFNFARLLKTTSTTDSAASEPAEGAGWVAEAQLVRFERFRVAYEDFTRPRPVRIVVAPLAGTYRNFSNARGAKGAVDVKATIDGKGRLAMAGTVATNPLAGNVRVDLRGFELAPMQPFLDEFVNVAITAGAVQAKGQLAFDLAGGVPKGGFNGDVEVTDFASIDKPTQSRLLQWKLLYLGRLQTTLEPLQVAIDEVELTDFYSRLILNADGTLNVQNLLSRPAGAPAGGVDMRADGTRDAEAVAADAQPFEERFAPGAPDAPAAIAAGGRTVVVTSGGSKGLPANISIGRITLAQGNVNFSDFFIKPNYSANLTGIAGTVGRLTPETPGHVELQGKVDQTAPVDIVGRINPLAPDLFVDIKAAARDIELPPLSPYSTKYAGYGIEKGKLSMDVKYLIENRKLSAENRVVLDQLTFGEKVDSPTATRLPVLLAVALLKDRNGVIDINLPISGSIDDPKFSVGGVILRVLVNLIVKAVTAPFALIGALVGGGEELAYVEFAPGSAKITPDAQAKLGNIARALSDRPALKMDVAGRIDAAADREGLRKAAVERQVRAQKAKAIGKGADAEDIAVDPSEYAEYLTSAYKAADFPKPRNMIGLVKDLPVPEMETLLLANAQASDEDLRLLANERAQVVKNWLVETAKLPAERVFLTAPRLSADDIKDKGLASRVDFSLR